MLKKAKFLVIGFVFFSVLFVFSGIYAAANENIAIKEEEGQYTIYTKDMGDNFIYFAFSDNENETSLVFESPKKDADNINVAFISSETYNTYFSDDNKSYMFIGNDISNLTKVEVDLSESINGSDIDLFNNLTNIIKIKTDKKSEISEEDTKTITTTIGTVKIVDESLTDIKYAILKDGYEDFISKLEEIKNLDSDKYEKIKKISELKGIYNALVLNTQLSPVSNNEIIQPEDTVNGDNYFLILSGKDNSGKVIHDIRLLTSFVSTDSVVKEATKQKEVEKVVNSPVTNDSLILITVAGGLLFILIVLILIKILNKKKVQNV